MDYRLYIYNNYFGVVGCGYILNKFICKSNGEQTAMMEEFQKGPWGINWQHP